MPVIYLMIVPLVVLDLFLEFYHRVCFLLYGIPYIKRTEHIRIDRQRLPYLTFMQKLNCAYCGYANGLLHYAAAIAAETERYWCPIKHQEKHGFKPPVHHASFAPYGDEQAFRKLNP
jgi:hypothetical protein